MSDAIAIVYPDEGTANQVRATLSRLQTEHVIELEDAVVVTKGQDGKVHLDQSLPLTSAGAASGAVTGGLWGALIGLLFPAPLLGFVLGGAFGALGGALGGKMSDFGINDDFMKQVGAKFTPGSSALFILVRKMTPDRVLEEIKQFGGTVVQTSLSREQEEDLQKAISGQRAQ